MKFQKKQKQDRRINAPFISWKVLLILYLIMYFLVIAQYFIIKGLGENKGVMISETRFVKAIFSLKTQFQNHYMNESVLHFRDWLFFHKNLYNLSFNCRTLFPT